MDGPVHKLQGHEAVLTELAPLDSIFFTIARGYCLPFDFFFSTRKEIYFDYYSSISILLMTLYLSPHTSLSLNKSWEIGGKIIQPRSFYIFGYWFPLTFSSFEKDRISIPPKSICERIYQNFLCCSLMS